MDVPRREFLAMGGKLVGAGAIAAVGGDRLTGGSSLLGRLMAGSSTTVNFQLGWIANVENMGPYMAADLGYYAKQGVNVNLVPGGPSVTVEPLVVSGKAFTGLDTVDTIARARTQGAPLKVVAVTLQNNPSCVMSLAKKPIKTPKDLIGKRLGIQQSGIAEYNTFLSMNGVNPKSVTFVPVQYDPAPLVDGRVDAFASFATSEPVELKLEGISTYSFLLASFGYNLWSDAYMVTESTLKDAARRKLLVGLLRGSVAGWKTACAQPDRAAAVIVDKFGKSLGLTLKSQEITAKAFVPLVETPGALKNGLLSMSAEGIEANIKAIRSEKINITAKELFDTSVIDEALHG